MGPRTRLRPLALGLVAACALFGRRAHAEDVLGAGPEEAPTEIIVDLQNSTSDQDEQEVEAELGGLHLKLNSIYAKAERVFVARVDPSEMDALIRRAKQDPRVEHVEPNQIYEALMVPNDPMWERQWSFRMVDAPTAWDGADGSGVTVAVIDTGVAYENYQRFRKVEDLEGTEFVKGYNFVSDDEHANDDHGHGTHVAGTIAEATNNGVGVAGLAYKAKIMPLKVLNRAGMGTAADIADAIRFAADEGAQVINMSLGGGGRSEVMASAVAYARKKGVVVICAAGNGSRGTVEYPAAYPGAFAVSAVGPDKKLAFYSSWGKEVAIAAPGGDKQKGGDTAAVLQNTITPDRIGTTNVYLAFQGTSMATPHVAGVAALIISAGVTNPDEVEAILKETADHVGGKAWDEHYGAGILNAGRAVEAAKSKAGGVQYLAAGILSLALFAWSGRRRGVKGTLGLGGLLGAVLGASGLFFLQHLVPGLGFLATAMPDWDGALFGAAFRETALWVSFVPVLVLSIVLLSVKRLRGFLTGLALGWAAHLILGAVTMPVDVRFIPGVAGLLDRGWLVLSALVLFALAHLIRNVATRRA